MTELIDPDLLKDFLVESGENLDQLDRDLLSLEQDPTSRPTLSSIFRTIHTIKGTCGFLGLGKLESVAHVGENLLSKMREGEVRLDQEIASTLLALVDAIREMLAHIDSHGSEGDKDYTLLVQRLVELQGAKVELIEAHAHGSHEEPKAVTAPAEPVATVSAPSTPVPAAPVAKVAEEAAEAVTGGGDARHPSASDSSIRVDVELLDRLMNRVGELVLARNQILQFCSRFNDAAFLSTCQRLNLITTELQGDVMKTRMQPIGNVWGKFPRVIRDLSVLCNKQVRLEMEGRETELDKTIIEAIKDPLTHLVRNAVDHGVETTEARLAAGKSPEGCLLLRAYHEGGQVNIEIVDDGGGLNLPRIRQLAIERGLITAEQAARLSDRDTGLLIFAPGFSTAAKVTNVSGRGVGMDVVKTNIEKIGGTVDIHSVPGHGTTVKLKIPLTLAIIPALVVTCHGDRFAIPQASLLELVRLEGDQASQRIENLHGAPVYRLRGQLLPIVYLRRELGLAEQSRVEGPQGDDIVNIVVLRADDRQFGLVVDTINDTEEIVVKPLSQQLKGIPVYAGATIMGDGRVALILDVIGMAHRANVVSETRDRGVNLQRGTETRDNQQTLMVLEVGNRRLALPVSLISRLEEIPQSSIEIADDREVVQYRDEILPLLRLGKLLDIPTQASPDAPLQVVVYSEQNRSVGLVVDRIADIVQSTLRANRPATSGDLLSSAVVQQRVTDLLNVRSLIERADPSFFAADQFTGVSA